MGFCSKTRRASIPFDAISTEYPSPVRKRRASSRMVFSSSTTRICSLYMGLSLVDQGGEFDRKGRSLADLALHLQTACVFLDNIIAHRETQTRSHLARLRRKKWIKDLLDQLGFDAAAGVFEPNHHHPLHRDGLYLGEIRARSQVAFAERINAYGAPLRHRIEGILD